jgi:hypothetical protein
LSHESVDGQIFVEHVELGVQLILLVGEERLAQVGAQADFLGCIRPKLEQALRHVA